MIKYLKYFQCIILFQVVLSSFLLSQIVKKSDNLIYSSKTGNLYTGKVFKLYEDGTKYYEGHYEDGLMNGIWTYYYTNAVVKAKGKFLHGNGGNPHNISEIPQNGRDGIWFLYYPNGNIHAKYQYKDGEFNDERLEWYPNGNKKITMHYMSGIPHGARLEWYKNDQKKLEYFYSYGTKNGTWSAWYPDGSKKHMYSYKNGQKDQLWTVWWPNKNKKIQGNYVDGKKDGNFISWFQNGQKKFETIFENNMKVKKWTYNSDKSKHTKYNYVNGKFEKIDGKEFHTHTKKNKTFN